MFWFCIQYAVLITSSAIISDDMNALGITCPQEHRARRDRKIKLRVLPLSGPTRLKQIKSLIFPLFLIKCIWDSVVGYRLVLSFSSQSPPAVWHSHPCSASVWLRSNYIVHIQPFVPLLWPYERRMNDSALLLWWICSRMACVMYLIYVYRCCLHSLEKNIGSL